jgi:cytoskeletal protein CcmA (bactofilin family)
MPLPPANGDSRAQLYAGAGVKVKGEISGCDSFRVEGDVDGQVSARHIVVAQNGVFKGTAHVEEAEIEGTVEGTLNVTGHLFLRSTGRLQGNVSYGQIEIERGGEVTGDINPHGTKVAGHAPTPKRPSPTATGAVVPIDTGARKAAAAH